MADEAHRIEDPSVEGIVCPLCGDKMLSSRKTLLQSIHLYWQKPWGPALKMDEPVVPYACMKCGHVMMFLRDSNKVRREYERLPQEETEKVIDTFAGDDAWFAQWAGEAVYRKALDKIAQVRPPCSVVDEQENLRFPPKQARWCVAFSERPGPADVTVSAPISPGKGVGLGIIGAGLYTTGTLVPLLQRHIDLRLRAVCDDLPDRVDDAVRSFGFEVGTTDASAAGQPVACRRTRT